MIGLEQRTGLELQQKLSMSPRLIQALGLLQLPVLELAGALQEELQENPVLEMDEDEESGIASERPEEANGVSDTGEWDIEAYLAEENICRGRSLAEYEAYPVETISAQWGSLAEDLRLQLHGARLAPSETAIGEYLVDCLDENGYLRKEALAGIGTPAELPRVLSVLKSFEPAGVFASNLQECLALQVERRGLAGSLAGRIVTNHFDLLARGRFADLATALGVARDEVLAAVSLIRSSLEPRPAAGYPSGEAISPCPDMTIQMRGAEWMVLVNESPFPRLQLNRHYLELWRSNPDDEKVRSYLKERIERARWILRAIEQRRATMQRVGEALLELQPRFFEKGPAQLRRMTLADMAEILEVHVSTISRAVAGKYVQTPFGVVALRSFFQSGVDTRTGGDRSASGVKQTIAALIAAENPKSPLSDDQLAAVLKKDGLVIARRTVTKYREELGVPSSRMRVR